MTERLGTLTAEMREKHVGRLTARFIRSLIVGQGDWQAGAEFAASRRWVESTIIEGTLKAAVTAHSRTDMAAALRTVGQDLAAVVRPLTIIGRLPGFRRVPAQVACVTETSAATAFWTDEGAAASLSALAFLRATLTDIRLTGMAVFTRELALSSDPSAEDTIMRDLAGAIVAKKDETFIDPTNAGSPEILPKSITHDAQQFVSSGSAVANIDSDLRLAMNALSDGGSDLQLAAWILNPRTAGYLATLRGSGGSPSYPGLGVRGGELCGLPALVSGSVLRTGSPQETFIALVDPSRIWLTESDDIELTVSTTTAIQMDNAAAGNSVTPNPTNLTSMWQTESVCAKAVTYANWRAMTAGSAATVITNVAY